MNFKNPALSIAMALTFLTASSGIAQETGQESITRASIHTPMPGMKAAYEEGVKKHQQWHKEHNDTWTFNVWQITSGPRTGDYVHVTSGHQWGDFDLSRYDCVAVPDSSGGVLLVCSTGCVDRGLPCVSTGTSAAALEPAIGASGITG